MDENLPKNKSVTEQNKDFILEKYKVIEDAVKHLTPGEKEKFYTEKFKEMNINFDDVKKLNDDTPFLKPSQIIASLGWLPVEQELSSIEVNYKLEKLIPVEMVKNAVKLIYYRDYTDVDSHDAYSMDDANYNFNFAYKAQGAINGYEPWSCTINIHKSFLALDGMLNDVTDKSALFAVLIQEFAFFVTRALKKAFYRLRAYMIANPLTVPTGLIDAPSGWATDWSTITPDFSITGADNYESFTKLETTLNSLQQASRNNIPTKWKLSTLPQNLEVEFDLAKWTLIVPLEWENMIKIQMKSGRWHDEYINVMPAIMGFDYQKLFGEYNGDTNFKHDATDADLILIPDISKIKECKTAIIRHYKGERSTDNMNLTSIVHEYDRVGIAWDRNFPFFKINWKCDTIVDANINVLATAPTK